MGTTTPSLADVIETGVSPWRSNVINTTGDDVIADALRPDGCLVISSSGQSPWDNPEDLVTKEAYDEFNKIVNVYFLTILVLISVPTNLINMAVFFRHGLRERINVCLFWLSFCDLVTVLGHFEWNLDGLVAAATGQPNQMVVMKVNVNNMIHSLAGFIYVSGFMSTLIALERCFGVVFPFRFKHMMQTRTTVVIVAIGTVLIFGGHVVIATRWEVVCMFDPSTQHTVLGFSSSQFYLHHKSLVDLFEGIIFGILLPGVYVVVVTVATAVTVYKLRQKPKSLSLSSSSINHNHNHNNSNSNININSNNNNKSNSNSNSNSPTTTTTINNNNNNMNKSDAKERTMTRMLIGASCLFIGCTVPPLVFHSLIPFVPDLSLSGKYYNTYLLFISVQQLLTYINSSINFFFYAFLGSRYRATVKSMFLCRVKARITGRRGGEVATGSSSSSSSKMSTTATASHDSETIPKVAEADWSMSFSAP